MASWMPIGLALGGIFTFGMVGGLFLWLYMAIRKRKKIKNEE
jgi:uncharacterized membrane protein YhfC